MQLIHEPDPLPEDEIDSTKEPSNYGSTLNTPVDSPFRASFPRDVFSPDTPARTQVNAALTECAPLVGRPKAERPGGATVLGIHNVAIVAPQFVVRRTLVPRLDGLTRSSRLRSSLPVSLSSRFGCKPVFLFPHSHLSHRCDTT